MSESVSTGGAGSAPSAGQTSTASQNTGAPQTQSAGNANGQAGGFATAGKEQAGGQAPDTQTPERIFADSDLDGFVVQKINGKEEKIRLRDALKGYGLDKAANQKMQEAAKLQKQQQQLNHLFQTDFDKWCEVTGVNKQDFLRSQLSRQKEIAEEVLAKEYELMQMDPNQRKAMELEQQLNQMKQTELQRKQPLIDAIKKLVPEEQLPQGLENATEQQLHQYYQQKNHEFQSGLDGLQNELLEAWKKTGLPKQKDFGAWIAQVMLDHQRHADKLKKETGEILPPLQPEEAAVKVKQRFLNSTRSLLSQMDAKAIQEALGQEIIKKLRDHDIGLASQQGPQFGNQKGPGSQPASEPKAALNEIGFRKWAGIAP